MSARFDWRKHSSVEFRTASALMGLNTRIPELDRLLGFIPKHTMLFIEGSQSRKHILELLCLRSIIQYQNYCIFIDGGNSFDPYLLSKLASAFKQNNREVLSKVILSRAFTSHQLASLIMNEMGKVIDRFPTNFIAVSDLLQLFIDPESDIDDSEIQIILPNILQCLSDLAKARNVIVAITSISASKCLNEMIQSYANIFLRVKDDKEIVRITLDKGPSHYVISTELTYDQLTLQSPSLIANSESIEPWLVAYG